MVNVCPFGSSRSKVRKIPCLRPHDKIVMIFVEFTVKWPSRTFLTEGMDPIEGAPLLGQKRSTATAWHWIPWSCMYLWLVSTFWHFLSKATGRRAENVRRAGPAFTWQCHSLPTSPAPGDNYCKPRTCLPEEATEATDARGSQGNNRRQTANWNVRFLQFYLMNS